MKQALVDIEDSRFYEHNGLDVQGTLRALVTNVAAGSVQEGGSTLTQQLVKQTLLQTAATPEEQQAATRSRRSAASSSEARLALALEETYSKDEILTRYLNIVYFGEGAYGIQAAAQKYFSVNAADLDPAAGRRCWPAWCRARPTTTRSPSPRTPQNRRNQVLQRMHTPRAHHATRSWPTSRPQPVAVVEGADPPNGCIDAALGGVLLRLRLQLPHRHAGARPTSEIKNGGWTIQTTLQPDLQRSGDQAVLNHVADGRPAAPASYDAVSRAPGTCWR